MTTKEKREELTHLRENLFNSNLELSLQDRANMMARIEKLEDELAVVKILKMGAAYLVFALAAAVIGNRNQ